MTIVRNYIIREIIKYFVLVQATVGTIYLVADFFERADKFFKAQMPLGRVLIYFLYKLPLIIAQVTPVGFLLALMITFGLMSKNNELISLRAGGVSVYLLFRPVLTLAVFFSAALFLFSDTVVPAAFQNANHIWHQDVRKERLVTTQRQDIWIKENHTIIHVDHYNPTKKMIYGLAFNYFDKHFQLVRRIDAAKGEFLGGTWRLYDIIDQRFDDTAGEAQVHFSEYRDERIPLAPEDFQRVVKKADEMRFDELRRYVHQVEREGYDASRYRTDLNAKIAFPLVCVILGMAGTAIALRGKSRDGLLVGITYSLVMAFGYWFFHSFCVSLGYGGILYPWLAAWSANLVFFCLAVGLMINTD
jgi:lipopolysaccharide export system permease protein